MKNLYKQFTTKNGADGSVTIGIESNGEGYFEFVIDAISPFENDYQISGWLYVENNELMDYDGCFELPQRVVELLRENNIKC